MPNQKKPRTVDIARALAGPVLERLGLELWDLRFEKEGANWYLRYFIDKPEGVNITDCENFSRAVDKLLDEADPIEQSYILEVSSPGVERELRSEEHFARYMGHRARVNLIRPIEGVKEITGELKGKSAKGVEICDDNGQEHMIPKENIASIRLATVLTGG